MQKKLLKYMINTVVDAEDIVSSVLFDNGIQGCEIEDSVGLTDEELKKQYVDIPLEREKTNKAKVSFYVEIYENNIEKEKDSNTEYNNKNVDISYMPSNNNKFTEDEIYNILYNVTKELHEYEENMYMGPLTIDREDLTGFDYMNKWKEFFKKIYIDNVCIKPSFEKIDEEDKDKIIINIDPKAAFGTGNHPTTRLCIKEILRCKKEKNIESLLDIGCGSGILGIVAKKIGIKNVVSVDVDESVKETILENIEMNDIKKEDFPLYFGNVIEDKNLQNALGYGKYDIIVANILVPVIVSLIEKGKIYNLLKSGGILIMSGIMEDKKDMVKECIKKVDNLVLLEEYQEGEWINVNCRII